MPQTASATQLAAQLADALHHRDLARADTIVAEMSPVPAEALPLAADLHFLRRRWNEAAALLGRVRTPDAAATLKFHLAKNLGALQVHRPAIYERLVALQRSERYRFIGGKGGRLTIADCIDPEAPCVLTVNQDPAAAVASAMQQLEQAFKQCSPLGLCGIGDGYLLAVLAQQNVQRLFGQQQLVYIFEPDEQLLFACLMLHDLSKPSGPIAQKRFRWFVGEGWDTAFRDAITNDLMTLPPNTMVRQGRGGDEISNGVQNASDRYGKLAERLRAEANEVYADRDTQHWAERFRSDGKTDPPRVLLMTTRFSSVLQYATRDAAEGFRQNGWDAHVIMEDQPWQLISDMAVRHELVAFKPDLVFQIDHLRHEHVEMVPIAVPFACWIQDHLTNLTSTEAGAGVGERDYVLTFASPLFIDTYGYPARQCIDMPMMLTRGRVDGEDQAIESHAYNDDLVYVSNVSQKPETLLPRMLSVMPPTLHGITRAATDHVIDLYTTGQCLQGHEQVRRALDAVCEIESVELSPEDHARVVDQLWNPLNITLYRQQSLKWVADAADSLGLNLGIYGDGWNANPQFARYARGVIEHGDALANLTRSTTLNLNLEPYVCYTHHRLLDGLTAGGFFLVREHPGNAALQSLLNLLEANDVVGETIEVARRQLTGDALAQFEALLGDASCGVVDTSGDPVRQVRCMQRAGVLIVQPEAIPRLPEVTFNDAASCKQLIERFINDAAAREQIVETQRASVEERLNFKAGMRHVIDRIAELLEQETKQEAKQVANQGADHGDARECKTPASPSLTGEPGASAA